MATGGSNGSARWEDLPNAKTQNQHRPSIGYGGDPSHRRFPFISSTRILDTRETVGEFMLNALRRNEGFSLSLFSARTALDSIQVEPHIASLCERDLLLRTGNQVKATMLGRRFLDTVVGEFF